MTDDNHLDCTNVKPRGWSSREADQFVAAYMLDWKMTFVGADARGENSCFILTENGHIPAGVELPRIGLINAAYLVPRFSESIEQAFKLASRFGFSRITFSLSDERRIPELIVSALVEHWEKGREAKQ